MFDPVVYFFILGIIARIIGSDLAIPKCMYETLTIYLMLAIGLMGGVELHEWLSVHLLMQAGLVMVFGVAVTTVVWLVLRAMSSYSDRDAKVVAAHYGSVSIGTYAVATSLLSSAGIAFEPYMPLFVAFLEFPAIIYAVMLLSKKEKCRKSIRTVFLECIEEKSVLLLVGSIIIGFIIGKSGMHLVAPLFISPFKGILALFLMEMGLLVGSKIAEIKSNWFEIVWLSLVMTSIGALFGLGAGLLMHLSYGGTVLMMTLGASASYVAVPAAITSSFPKANVALALTHSLGITFTFNVLCGIYIYKWIAHIFV